MRFFKILHNYLCYCGIEKDEYNALKKDAYISNFVVWRVLHCFMTAVFALLFINSLMFKILILNRIIYLAGFLYSATVTVLFLFVFKKDSLVAQLIIYLSISALFLLAAMISQNNPTFPSTVFIVIIILTPMFMIDKPYFMAIELSAASAIFLIWMHGVKDYEVWQIDAVNVMIFMVIAMFIHVVANSIRIKEFVLRRTISMQKDHDELTGLKSKSALTREINEYLSDEKTNKGLMFLMDFDRFKAINDKYGHDVGDDVITQFGAFLKTMFMEDDIVGRFGGDEFIVFIKNTDDIAFAEETARRITEDSAEYVILPEKKRKFSVSIGIAVYTGSEKNYSEIFKKADVALYKTKADRTVKYNIYNDQTV